MTLIEKVMRNIIYAFNFDIIERFSITRRIINVTIFIAIIKI